MVPNGVKHLHTSFCKLFTQIVIVLKAETCKHVLINFVVVFLNCRVLLRIIMVWVDVVSLTNVLVKWNMLVEH